MGIGATLLGTSTPGSGSTAVFVFPVAVAAGSTVFLQSSTLDGTNLTSIVDARGNPYIVGAKVALSPGELRYGYCLTTTTTINIGDTLTATWNGNGSHHQIMVIALTGVLSIDTTSKTSGVSSNPSLSSQTPFKNINGELILFGFFAKSAGADPGFVDDLNITNLGYIVNTDNFGLGYIVPVSQSPLAYSPNLGQSYPWAMQSVSFAGVVTQNYLTRVSQVIVSDSIVSNLPKVIDTGFQFDTSTTDPMGNLLWPITTRDVAAKNFRIGIATNKTMVSQAPFFAALPTGVKMLCNIKNVESNVNVFPSNSVNYKAFFTLLLQTYGSQIGWISIENELDTPPTTMQLISPGVVATSGQLADHTQSQAIATATMAAYAAEMVLAVQACHAAGFTKTAMNISGTGIKLAYWYWLWINAYYNVADAFASLTFNHLSDGISGSDLPNSSNTSQPILTNNIPAYLHMLTAYALLQNVAATGVDYFSLHFFSRTPQNAGVINAMQWAIQFVGLPCISDAAGNRSTDVAVTNSVMNLMDIFPFKFFSFFGNFGANSSTPISYADGSLNPQGEAVRAAYIKYTFVKTIVNTAKTFGYQFLALAFKLINKFGTTLTITSQSNSEYDVISGRNTITPGAAQTIKGIPEEYADSIRFLGSKLVPGTGVLNASKKITVAALGINIAPKVGDQVTQFGLTYVVNGVALGVAGEYIIYYVLHLSLA